MTKTQTKKVAAIGVLGVLLVANFSAAFAATQIGTGSVTGNSAFDTAIMWDDQFPGTATGEVSNIKIKAQVQPALNMEISAEEIDLGVLTPGTAATGNLDIEIGTNAKDGVSITARSTNGGLNHTTQTGVQINDLTTDGVAESYTWGSTPNATHDSSNSTFTSAGLTALEVNDNSTEHAIYTTNKPEATQNVDDVKFEVSATAGAETPAGDYEDFVTFTVTGNF